jgi:methionyl-tRNA synthetase
MSKQFYITTTLPYVNAEPHIGFAMEIIRADIIARWKKQQGYDVFFNTGTDEHGAKVWQKAKEEGKDIMAYVDECAEKFKDLKDLLGLSLDLNFIRTTDSAHVKAAQEFWKKCDERGYIYKKNYKIKYCVGCELEKTESELVNGRCPIHPNVEPEVIEEENYFFKFSEFRGSLLALYKKMPDFVVPEFRFNEIKAFVERGLQDFSISRLKTKMPWGVPVPNDDNHVMYVWFDALVNYVSAVGWPEDEKKFKKWWLDTGGVVQYCGKDNLRQQSAMWQAMLMAVGLPPSKTIVINGFITKDGQKISKSQGNTIDPRAVVSEYGCEALRYYVARELHPFEDSDFTDEGFKKSYNGNLANGLGNVVSRVIQMMVVNGVRVDADSSFPGDFTGGFESAMEKFDIKSACDEVWRIIQKIDQRIQDIQPFKLIKTEPQRGKDEIALLGREVLGVAKMVYPILPETSRKIISAMREDRKPENLFPRKI